MPVKTKEQIDALIKAQDFEIPEGYIPFSALLDEAEVEQFLTILKKTKPLKIERALKVFDLNNDFTKFNIDLYFGKEYSITPKGYNYEITIDKEIYSDISLDFYIDYTINKKEIYCSFAFIGKNLLIIVDTLIKYKDATILGEYFTDIWTVLD